MIYLLSRLLALTNVTTLPGNAKKWLINTLVMLYNSVLWNCIQTKYANVNYHESKNVLWRNSRCSLVCRGPAVPSWGQQSNRRCCFLESSEMWKCLWGKSRLYVFFHRFLFSAKPFFKAEPCEKIEIKANMRRLLMLLHKVTHHRNVSKRTNIFLLWHEHDFLNIVSCERFGLPHYFPEVSTLRHTLKA